MDWRTLILCFASLCLVASGIYFGAQFVRRRNYLVGVEWWILALSSTNACVFFVTGWTTNFAVAHFFDAFSRAFGMPIIATIGLMTLTHRLKPSIMVDVVLFVAAFVATAFLVMAKAPTQLLPYFYLGMWSLFSIYLVYFAVRLIRVGETAHAVGLLLAMAASQIIASIYDFYKIPGEETNVVFNFLTLALLAWSWLAAQIHYAYVALERASAKEAV